MNFSIVIVSYNTRHLLKGCIESIFEVETRSKFELVIVDNNSTDGSQELIEKIYPKCKLIANKTNLGFAAANNIGIRHSKGKHLIFLNPDTKVLSPGFKPLIEFLENKPQVGMVGPQLLNSKGTLQPSCRSFPSIFNMFSESFFLYKLFPHTKTFGKYYMTFFDHKKTRQVDWMKGACFAIPKKVLQDVGLFDEKFFLYAEEVDLAKRIKNTGYEIWFLPEVKVIHYGGKSAEQQGQESYLQNLRSQFIYLEKHLTRQAIMGKKLITLGTLLRFILWTPPILSLSKEMRKNARKRRGIYWSGVKWGWRQLRKKE